MKWRAVGIILGALFIAQAGAEGSHQDRQEKKRVFRKVKLTAYCSCRICTGKWSAGNRTASGVRPVKLFTVAADLRVFPMGTILNVPSIGAVMVQDTGSAVRGLHLDVYHGGKSEHGAARVFGVQHAEVEVLHVGGSKW